MEVRLVDVLWPPGGSDQSERVGRFDQLRGVRRMALDIGDGSQECRVLSVLSARALSGHNHLH